MESLGERLRKGREEKGIALEAVFKATKISKNILRALENDQYEIFPPQVLVRGFIRSYARYVGLDEKELINLYETVCTTKKTGEVLVEEKARKRTDRKKMFILFILLIGLVILLIYPFFIKSIEKAKTISEPEKNLNMVKPAAPSLQSTPSLVEPSLPTETTSPTVNPLPEIKTEEPLPSPPSPPPPASIPMQMKIKCQSKTWIGFSIDNGPTSQVTLSPGDEASWEGKDKIELKVGNAGGIKIMVNGSQLKPLGKLGEVISVVFEKNAVCIGGGEPQDLEAWQEKGEFHSDLKPEKTL